MSGKAEPWQKAEIAGPEKALPIRKPEVVVGLVKKSERPLLVVGHHAVEDYSEEVKMIDYAVKLGKNAGIPVVATGHIIRDFINRDFPSASHMSAMDIGNRLKDPEWQGLDGEGGYDVALFMGLPYYMQFVLLSGLKHFATNIKTICLDRFYNPHASWSFPNLSIEDWNKNLEVIVNKLGGM